VSHVEDQADAPTSTASVWLAHNELPDVPVWIAEFKAHANASYDIRGFEVTAAGDIVRQGDVLSLRVGGRLVRLSPLGDDQKVQWDWARKARAAVAPHEAAAFADLEATLAGTWSPVTVTGPLIERDGEWTLAVRAFTP
jgi:hypothetical protein